MSVRVGLTHTRAEVLWTPDKLAYSNMIVAGGSGEGKTQCTKTWIMRRLLKRDNSKVHIFDMQREYVDLAQMS